MIVKISVGLIFVNVVNFDGNFVLISSTVQYSLEISWI